MATYNGQVTGGGLNLRKSASTTSDKLTQIPNNTKIVVSDYSGNSSWYCTTYGSYSGFVMKQYVNILSNVASQSATVTGGGLNLRLYPSTAASSPVQIPNNKNITVQKHNDSWSSTTYDGHSGFVMSKFLTIGGSTGGDGGSTGGGGTGGTTTSNFTKGNFGKTNAVAVNVRKEAKKTVEGYGQVRKGSTFYIEGVVTGGAINGNTDWVKVRYGTESGGNISAYIHSSYFEDIGTPPSDAKNRCIAIAKSLVENKGESLGLTGDWCQNFIYWLCGACGKTVTCMSFGEGYCGDARRVMVNKYKATWNSWYSGLEPHVGDLVYYGVRGSDESSHVGLVVSVDKTEKKYTSIEGNILVNGNKFVKKRTGDYSTGTCSNMTIQGFLTPAW